MTIEQFLAEQGLSTEEIAAVVGNPAQSKAMTAALKRHEEGLAAQAASAAEKAETARFWEQKTQELQGSVNRLTAAEKRAASAEAAAAQRTSYLKSLKEQGYDVPDEMVAGSTTAPEPEKPFTREEFQRGMRSTAPDLVSLTALSNEYYDLFGSPYVAVEDDFRAAQQAGKPLREFARSKYNFDGKKQEKAAAADQKRIDAIVAEQMKAKESELAAKYGSNPNLSTPMPSKFDKLVKAPGFKEDSWKSAAGRQQNRAERMKRFENVSIN